MVSGTVLRANERVRLTRMQPSRTSVFRRALVLVALAVAITFREPNKSNGLTYHLHAVAAGRRWVWILGGPFLSRLAQGRCLDRSRLASTA